MRAIIATAAVAALLSMAVGPSYAQSSYNRCVQRASQQGLSAKSASGRKFINRCMQRGTKSRATATRSPSDSSRNCPDDPKARSAYPAWMCR
jgi:hypothetical protein